MAKPVTQDLIDQYTEAAAKLRPLIREAHEAQKALNEERRALRLEREHFVSSRDLIVRLDNAVAEAISVYQDRTLKLIEETEDAMWRRFDTVMAIMFGEDPESVKNGNKSIIDLVKDFVKSRGIPIRMTEEVHLLMSSASRDEQRARFGGMTFPSGRNFDKLPIFVDQRVPDGIAFLYIPAASEGEKARMIELKLGTGDGADTAAEALAELFQRQAECLPPGLRPPPLAELEKTEGPKPSR